VHGNRQLFIFVIILSVTFSAGSLLAKPSEFQNWSTVSAKASAGDFKFVVAEENRINSDGLFVFNVDFNVGRTFPFGTLYLGFKEEFDRKNDWEGEERPMISLVTPIGSGVVTAENRLKFDLRFLPDEYKTRMRERLKIKVKLSKNWGWDVAEELLTTNGIIMESRFTSGFSWKPVSWLKAGAGYLWREKASIRAHALTLSIGLSI
jgi:hypothetical protein